MGVSQILKRCSDQKNVNLSEEGGVLHDAKNDSYIEQKIHVDAKADKVRWHI